jgi:hypothetical protein
MNAQQASLFDRAGELARTFHEARRRKLKEPGPDRPWFFHPLGYWIDVGYTGAIPEYDQPQAIIDPRTVDFAKRMGSLSQITKIWEDKEAMVFNSLAAITILEYCEGSPPTSFGF